MRIRESIPFRSALIAILALSSLPCFAGEVAVLKNGFSIRHERREVVGNVTRLYVNAEGSSFVDVPTAEIEHFEPAPDLPASASAHGGSQTKITPPSPFLRPEPTRSSAAQLSEVINTASDRYLLDPDLVASVIRAESGFNVRAVSPKGAQGLMQLMPGTASELGVANAFDAQANVEGGTRYLRELLERYNFDLVKALAAYNAGPQRVEQFGGVPPYYETRAYVARVVKDFNKKKLAQRNATASRTNSPSKTVAAAHAAAAKPHAGAVAQAGISTHSPADK